MALNMPSIALFIMLGQLHGHYFQTTKEEPQCLSRFDHDYKVLQKLVDLEQRIMTNEQREAMIEQKMKDLEHRLSGDGMNTTCPNGWTYFENSCYTFVDDFVTTWSTALQHCENYGKGSHLVTIETAREQAFLQRSAKRLKSSVGSERFYWVGATDAAHEGQYVWQATGQLVSDTGAYWYPGQNPGSQSQDCACLWGNSDFTLHDHPCDRKGYYICEKKINI